MINLFKNSIDAKEIRQTIEAILKKHEKELTYFTTFNNKYLMLELEDRYLIKLVLFQLFLSFHSLCYLF